jgi:hypothetical protein
MQEIYAAAFLALKAASGDRRLPLINASLQRAQAARSKGLKRFYVDEFYRSTEEIITEMAMRDA